MTNVPVRCSHCQAVYQVPDAALGGEIVCPHCRQPFAPAFREDPSSKRSSPWWWVSEAASASSLAPTVPQTGEPPAAAPAADTWKPGDVILDLYEVREVF